MNFADQLHDGVRRIGNPCILGIDPHPELLPEEFRVDRDSGATRVDRALAVTEFCLELIDLARNRVCAVKPQSAFFEELGADGAVAWETVVAAAHESGLLVVGDVKRGDIASTAAAYGRAFLGESRPRATHFCDAITVSPYLGGDSVEPLLAACEKTDCGIFVLVRTSNPGGADLQLHGDPPLWREVARLVDDWGSRLVGSCGLSSVGAVVGVTHSSDLAALRSALPRATLLLPGYGAQGGSASGLAGAFLPGGHGALVSSSRSIAFAYRESPGIPWKDAAHRALEEMVNEVSQAIGISRTHR